MTSDENLPRVPLALPFTAPWLLAPMEGVTEPCFRDLVLAENSKSRLGGAFTEFARVVREPLPKRTLREHLGTRRFEAPVGLQLMGSDLASLALTAARAAEIGAPLVDLNFGCPAKGAIRTCAGSALLREPRAIEEIVRTCVEAVRSCGERERSPVAAVLSRAEVAHVRTETEAETENARVASEQTHAESEHTLIRSKHSIPVTAKIRAGYDDASLLEDLARAAEAGGASMLTVHCRTRVEAYQDEVDWQRIARAVAAVKIPVCGNGGINCHADFKRMQSETGCAFAMAGRAALGDPWIFSGTRVTRARAAVFLLAYAERLTTTGTAGLRGAAGRVKQLLRYWTAGDLVGDERESWMREPDPEALFARLRAIAGEAETSCTESDADPRRTARIGA